MDEAFYSGYCRALDGARTVAVERDGEEVTADCDFGCCPHSGDCPIAAKIREFAGESQRR